MVSTTATKGATQGELRNIAIIAHVDHGKTTLVDQLLRQSGTFAVHQQVTERVMDSNDLERERGITILSKNCAITWKGVRINIIDTPGHADFGGEVERVLSMVDSVLLLVDALEGPMPQTRFVTQKALATGVRPIVVVNKIDRPGARPDEVINSTFDLFDHLGATDEQLDFPVVYCSALNGYASLESDVREGTMDPLFQAIVDHAPQPDVDKDAPLQLQVSTLDYSTYTGRIGIGRIRKGSIVPGEKITLINEAGTRPAKISQLLGFNGLERVIIDRAEAGDIVAVSGIEDVGIGDTLCDPEHVEMLPPISVDEPTLAMFFQVNTSPFAGKEGKYVTSRNLRDRLYKELNSNVALRVEDTENAEVFLVSGRGELHLTILLENMRREGYELAVSRPRVIEKTIDGVRSEPVEMLTMDVEDAHSGTIIDELGQRKGEMLSMDGDGRGRTRLVYKVCARALIGWQTLFVNLTRGTGLMGNVFDSYQPHVGSLPQRAHGALVSMADCTAVGYALDKLQERGRMMVVPSDPVYEGMVIGWNNRDGDLLVNPGKAKQLTNFRVSGKEDSLQLTPPIVLTLETAIESISEDELVEITPESIRIRKRLLKGHERKRA